MICHQLIRRQIAAAVLMAFIAFQAVAGAPAPLGLEISEFCIDAPQPGGQDEYIEISGPGHTKCFDAAVAGEFTYYLLMLENERENAGTVDKIIPLSGVELNLAGRVWFYSEEGERYPAEGGYQYDGTSENSGCTLMIVAVPFGQSAPAKSHDYDDSADGVAKLGRDWNPAWIVLDSVGVMCEQKDAVKGGALYAQVNFAAGDFANIVTPSGAVNVNTDCYAPGVRGAFNEIKDVGRTLGNQWFAANLIDSGDGWSPENRNYRIANDDENEDEPECIDQDHQIPYPALKDITVTLGEFAPCNCGSSSASADDAAPSAATGPEPTLAEPISSRDSQRASK